MEDIRLSQPAVPISCDSGYVSKTNSTITFRCHDKHFRDAVACDENGNTWFKLGADSLWTSWSLRRTLRSAADDKHILDVRHHNSKYKEWVAEDPQGRRLCLVKDSVSKVGKATSMQAQVVAKEVVGDHIIVDMQSSDRAGTKTVFRVGEVAIAEMNIVENNDLSFLGTRGLDRSVWKIRLAAGVDIALILALAYCRAEVLHIWRR
jgi:hypothetical protein